MKYVDYADRIDYLIEIRGLYDGWSVAKLTDGTYVNRWENDEGTGPEPGYERRYDATRKFPEEEVVRDADLEAPADPAA